MENNFKVTESQFNDYVRCQHIGAWNMLDYNSYKNNGFTKLSKEDWFYIICNYSDLKKAYSASVN